MQEIVQSSPFDVHATPLGNPSLNSRSNKDLSYILDVYPDLRLGRE